MEKTWTGWKDFSAEKLSEIPRKEGVTSGVTSSYVSNHFGDSVQLLIGP